MPEWVWVFIVAGAVAALVVVLMMLVKRGGKLTVGGQAIVVNGEVERPDSPLTKPLRFSAEKVTAMHGYLFRRYLGLMKEAGANEDRLAEYGDAKFVRQLLYKVVAGGNGSRSVQKLIETHIVNGRWAGKDPFDYTKSDLWPQVIATLKDVLNSEYDSRVLLRNGEFQDRWVSLTKVCDAYEDDETKTVLTAIIGPIFAYAATCIKAGCEDK